MVQKAVFEDRQYSSFVSLCCFVILPILHSLHVYIFVLLFAHASVLARDAFVRTNRRANAIMLVRLSVCMFV